MLRIRINKCSSESYWYRSFVGDIFSVIDSDERIYYIDPPGTWGSTREYGVLKDDAEIVVPDLAVEEVE